MCTYVRVDLDDVSLRLTPTDALLESGWSVDGEVGRGLERSHLATRKVDELSGGSDGWWAEVYSAIKVQHLHGGIPARREDGVIAMSGMHRDEITLFPLFWEG